VISSAAVNRRIQIVLWATVSATALLFVGLIWMAVAGDARDRCVVSSHAPGNYATLRVDHSPLPRWTCIYQTGDGERVRRTMWFWSDY
jgi:hypothetical protein